MHITLKHVATAVVVVFLMLSWSSVTGEHAVQAATRYHCALYGYSFQIPAGWHMAKPDIAKCAVKPTDPTSQSSPLFFSASGRAFLNVDVIKNKSYPAVQWITDYAGLLGIASKSFKVGTAAVNQRIFAAVARPVVTKDRTGTYRLFLVLAGLQRHGRLYGFVGGVALDQNPAPNGDIGQLRAAFTSLQIN